jgi:hypothetical protein
MGGVVGVDLHVVPTRKIATPSVHSPIHQVFGGALGIAAACRPAITGPMLSLCSAPSMLSA